MDQYRRMTRDLLYCSSCMFHSTYGYPLYVEWIRESCTGAGRTVLDTWDRSSRFASTVQDIVCGRRDHSRVFDTCARSCPRGTLDTGASGLSEGYTFRDCHVQISNTGTPYASAPCTAPASCSTRRGKSVRGRRARRWSTSLWSERMASRYFIRIPSSTLFLKTIMGSVSCSVRQV
jgi:hypothetical protein